MCRVLQVNRSTYYYEAAAKKDESELTADIQEIFRKSRNHYGTRKIKKELADCGKQVSRRRIGRIMKQEGLVSSYTTAQFKPQKDRCNESKVENVLNRQFQNQPYRNVVVSDLTYVRVGNRWNYICVLIDLFNREIIGYSAGEHKTAATPKSKRTFNTTAKAIKFKPRKYKKYFFILITSSCLWYCKPPEPEILP